MAAGSRFHVEVKGADWRKAFKAFETRVYVAYQRTIDHFAVALNRTVVENTPVWEGTTLRNWRWAIGHADLGPAKPPEGEGIDPGRTNSMALGTEPRRAVNTIAEMEDFADFVTALNHRTGKPVDIFLTNTADSAAAIEYGQLPSPSQSRRPKGVLFLSLLETLTAMGVR